MHQLTEDQIRDSEKGFYSKDHPLCNTDSSNWLEGVRWAQSYYKDYAKKAIEATIKNAKDNSLTQSQTDWELTESQTLEQFS